MDVLRKVSGMILDKIGQFSRLRKQDIYIFIQERERKKKNIIIRRNFFLFFMIVLSFLILNILLLFL
jgi:hypothetical protein